MVGKIKNQDPPTRCEPITRTPLILGGEVIGIIDKYGQPWSPLPAEKILNDPWKPERPVFLQEQPDASFCAYPVHTDVSLSHKTIFPFQFSNNPRLFGTPTRLKIDPKDPPPFGTLYNPEDGRFYMPDYLGLKWYLVGDKENYRKFMRAGEGISQSLFSLVSGDFAREYLGPFDIEIPMVTAEEAYQEIKAFLAWLKGFDSNLWRQVYEKVEYSAAWPDGCSIPGHPEPISQMVNEQLYPERKNFAAYLERRDHKIYLMPHTIALLKRREYRQAAEEILVHENAHRINDSAGLVPPSEQLVHLSVINFIAPYHGYSLTEGLRLYLQHDRFYHRKFIDEVDQFLCQLLLIIPEEEKSAYLEEVRYNTYRPGGHDGPKYPQQAIAAYHFLEKSPISQSSFEWRDLSAQYLLLSQRTNQATPEEKRIFDALHTNPLGGTLWTFSPPEPATPFLLGDSLKNFPWKLDFGMGI